MVGCRWPMVGSQVLAEWQLCRPRRGPLWGLGQAPQGQPAVVLSEEMPSLGMG